VVATRERRDHPSHRRAGKQAADRVTSVGWSAHAIATAVRGGELTAQQVVTDHLDAISAREPDLRAWVHLDGDAALAAARAVDLDASGAGPLAGVPVGVKDIVDVAGMPTRNGSTIPVRAPASADAVAVARLRAAGAIPIGKTVTTEFALFQPGPTRHPFDATRTPGGSSSGSAAAVAAGTVPLAIGTQTAGSVVRPASFCGIVGAKPTFGAVPREGVTSCSSTLDTIGMLGASVDDVALSLGLMAGDREAFDPVDLGGRPRIGFCRTFEWDDIHPDTRRAVEAGIERLAGEADIVEVVMPEGMRGLVAAQLAIMLVECADELDAVRTAHGEHLSASLHQVLRRGHGHRWAYDAAKAHAASAATHLGELFADGDVLIAPSVLGEAPTRETTGDPLLCRQWTLLGTPTVAVPGLLGSEGLPLGVQVVAPVGRDDLALGGAAWLAERLGGPGTDTLRARKTSTPQDG
jgi:Asp-tRNA(Asn)/Glu-tRNA(Gln) amidotransferase A subunit family amidase